MFPKDQKDPVTLRKVFSEDIRWQYPLEILESKMVFNKPAFVVKALKEEKEKDLFIGGSIWHLPI